MVHLTEKEIVILEASRRNNFCDAYTGASPWVFAVIETSGLDPRTARGVIGSLVRKGLAIVDDYEGKGRADDMTFSLTPEGVKAIGEHNIKDAD